MNVPEPYQPSTTSQCLNGWDVQSKHIQPENGKAEALYSGECRGGGGESYVYCLQGNGIDRADTAGCNGKGWREDQSYTLNTIDRPAVCYEPQVTGPLMASGYAKNGTQEAMNGMYVVQEPVGIDLYNQTVTGDVSKTLNSVRSDADHVPCVYGLDRASFNQGENAKYDFSVEEEKAQTLVSRGPGGGTSETVGALCARDFKGVGNQYVNEHKCIVVGWESNSSDTNLK